MHTYNVVATSLGCQSDMMTCSELCKSGQAVLAHKETTRKAPSHDAVVSNIYGYQLHK